MISGHVWHAGTDLPPLGVEVVGWWEDTGESPATLRRAPTAAWSDGKAWETAEFCRHRIPQFWRRIVPGE